MDTQKSEPLSISTRRVRPTVKIDGVDYQLVCPEDLEVKDALWLEKTGPKINRLANQLRDGEYDEETAEQLGREVLHVSDIVLGEVPAEVRQRLTQMQKLMVIQTYISRLGGFGFFAGGPEDGAASSPGSAGSTEEAPPTGAP